MSKWKSISNDYEDDEGQVYIDAWETDNDDEQGKSIARVSLTENAKIVVEYFDKDAKFDRYAQDSIKEAIDELDSKKTIIQDKYKRLMSLIWECKDVAKNLYKNEEFIQLKEDLEEYFKI